MEGTWEYLPGIKEVPSQLHARVLVKNYQEKIGIDANWEFRESRPAKTICRTAGHGPKHGESSDDKSALPPTFSMKFAWLESEYSNATAMESSVVWDTSYVSFPYNKRPSACFGGQGFPSLVTPHYQSQSPLHHHSRHASRLGKIILGTRLIHSRGGLERTTEHAEHTELCPHPSLVSVPCIPVRPWLNKHRSDSSPKITRHTGLTFFISLSTTCTTTAEALARIEGDALAPTQAIVVRSVSGEEFDRIVDYELGPMPKPMEHRVFLCEFTDEEIPF